MLTGPQIVRAGVIAFSDHDRGDLRYVTAALPRLMIDAQGTPEIQLVQWVAADGSGVAGGRLNLGLTLDVSPEMLAEAGLSAALTEPVPWQRATVTVRGQGFESEPAEVAITAPLRARVGVDLDPPAAGLLAELLRRGSRSSLQVIWTGHTLLRMPEASVRAHVSRSEIVQRARQAGSGRETLRALIAASATIVIDAGSNEALADQLRDFVVERLLDQYDRQEVMVVEAGAADIVDWPLRFSATLDEIGTGEDDRVHTIVLDSQELGHGPALEVRVLGDFDGELDRVDVEIGQHDVAMHLAFADAGPQTLRLEQRPYRWRMRVKRRSQAVADWTQWRDVAWSSSLLLPVRSNRTDSIEIVAAGIAFAARWQAVDVELTPAAAGGPTLVAHLDAARTSARLDLSEDTERAEVGVAIRFRALNGLSVQRTDTLAAEQTLLLIRDPFAEGALRTALVPTGTGWDDVAMVMVDLRYDDGDERNEQTLSLRTRDDLAEWRIPVRAEGPRQYRWRYHASFRDGRLEQSAWRETDEQLLAIELNAPNRRELQILPVFLRDGETAEVRIETASLTETLTFDTTEPQRLRLPAGPYRWQATWRSADRPDARSDLHDDDRDVIVLPRSP